MRSIEIEISGEPIDPCQRRRDFSVPENCGGYVSFEGIVRRANHGRIVVGLIYESYYELALAELTRIANEVADYRDLNSVRIVHRTGKLSVGDVAVQIQVAGAHRDEAFRGCRAIIDELKATVPIWKREFYEDGTSSWTRCSHGQHPYRSH